MNNETKVLSRTKDGSTTITNMLIDGHSYVVVRDGIKIVSKTHCSDCVKCADAATASKYGISESEIDSVLYATFKDGTHRRLTDAEIERVLEHREWCAKSTFYRKLTKKATIEDILEEHPTAKKVGGFFGSVIGTLLGR